MASERQIAANRRNAARSTGPRTAPGKRRSSANAVRHGLSARRHGRETAAGSIAELTRALAGDGDHAGSSDHARAAAEAIWVLARAQQVKAALLGKHVRPEHAGTDPVPVAIRPALPDLVRLDRYERRAGAARDAALLALAASDTAAASKAAEEGPRQNEPNPGKRAP